MSDANQISGRLIYGGQEGMRWVKLRIRKLVYKLFSIVQTDLSIVVQRYS